ncbi:MAG: glycosyltransferase [Selenomonas sp.]|nr:glycosyltransferase [Selenomonas sp.]
MINIAAQIPPRSKRVVELGCLREKAGEAFLRIQPKAEYWGITDDLEEMKEARKFLTHAVYALPEEVDFEKLGIYEADAIIIRGSYFRGMTPERLKKWAEALSENGQLIFDIPNPAYIRSYLDLMAGGQGGGNIHGLSAIAARKLIADAGLYMLSAKASYDWKRDGKLRKSRENASLMDGLRSMLSSLGYRIAKENDPWLQSFFFKVGKKPVAEEERILIQTLVGEGIVTAAKRVYEPQDFMAAESGVTCMAIDIRRKHEEFIPSGKANIKVLIRQRLSYTSIENAMETIGALRKAGYLLSAEIDDNPAFFTNEQNVDARAITYIGTHCLQTSTEPLADILRQQNPHVAVFPNQLRELPEKRNYLLERLQKLKEGEDYVTFFFGALNRTHEWQEVMPVLREAIEKYGSKLRFKVLSDLGFYETLPTEYKEFIGSRDMFDGQFVPYHMYTEALHSSDISFLPLRDNDFNRTKSDLKFIESAGHGAVVLASPTVYEATVRDGRNGFLYRDTREFKEYLTLLIENRERRLETAEAAYRYVQEERLLSGHYLERVAWYREMAARREELDREMMKRLADWQQQEGSR